MPGNGTVQLAEFAASSALQCVSLATKQTLVFRRRVDLLISWNHSAFGGGGYSHYVLKNIPLFYQLDTLVLFQILWELLINMNLD